MYVWLGILVAQDFRDLGLPGGLWLRFHASNAGGTGSIPDLGSTILYAVQYVKIKKKNVLKDYRI